MRRKATWKGAVLSLGATLGAILAAACGADATGRGAAGPEQVAPPAASTTPLECAAVGHSGWTPTVAEIDAALASLPGLCLGIWDAPPGPVCGNSGERRDFQAAYASCTKSRGSALVDLVLKLPSPRPECAPACAVRVNAREWQGRRFVVVDERVPGWVPIVAVTDTFEIGPGGPRPYFRGTPGDCPVKGEEDTAALYAPLGARGVFSDAFKADLPTMPSEVARALCGYPVDR